MFDKVKKRDRRVVPYDKEKIAQAIFNAARSVGGSNLELSRKLADKVETHLVEQLGDEIPEVETIQDAVEKTLIKQGHAATAKAFILYRQKRTEIREAKSLLTGVEDDIKLTLNAVKVLERRYLLKDSEGRVMETPSEMFQRVASNIAEAELNYGTEEDVEKWSREFYELMRSLIFLPNSPTLMNAGTSLQQLSACFVLPIPDTMEDIFNAVKYTALIHKSGGGTGFSFSGIRPSEDIVKSTGGVASGPISFMRVFDVATDVIKQGGRRRGANMGILRYDHPDIFDFITAKDMTVQFSNFNISVGIDEEFMKAVEKNVTIELKNPRNNEVVRTVKARAIFDLLVYNAWKTGDPGIVFLDRLNKDNPTPHIGQIESTNPCGEQPLLPYEACNLGSINLDKMVKDNSINYDLLKETVHKSVRFLDDVIDQSKFPIEQITKMVRANRKIGLGVMGFADLLIQLGISYDSEEAISVADEIIKFIEIEAKKASQKLAEERGPFTNFKGSTFDKNGEAPIRNATKLTIAPTGSISILAGCSSGIEPLFAVVYIRSVMEGTELLETNKYFEGIAKEKGFYSDSLMHQVALTGSIRDVTGIPDDIRSIFVTAHDIEPKWHVRMQAAFQKWVDNAVSKTVNLSYYATPKDVEEIYLLGYKLGVKGITIYRDGSKGEQVLYRGEKKTNPEESTPHPRIEPPRVDLGEGMFKVDSDYSGGCKTCEF
ncbi:vitamin B12-dependent ribonucleotide reductase [candidate division WOR-3 bacterium]|nr:vitamin B12-dependent ribonucleotide reductase [candidate division WOR-3 bacterium]